MLRIDETSGTLVAPEDAMGPEADLAGEELVALLAAGWSAFAAEIGRPGLHLVGPGLAPGADLLTIDEAGGRVTVVAVGGGLEGALRGAAEIAGWDAERLAATHPKLTAAVPGESPALLLVGANFEPELLAALDWLARHGIAAEAHRARPLRFGAERLLDVARAYPEAAVAAAAAAPGFVAGLAQPPAAAPADAPPPPAAGEATPAPAHSAPPPGVPA